MNKNGHQIGITRVYGLNNDANRTSTDTFYSKLTTVLRNNRNNTGIIILRHEWTVK